MNKIRKVVLTGGPCAGKTHVLNCIKEKYCENVMVVPEVATQLLQIPHSSGGIGKPGVDLDWSQEWQDKLQEQVIIKQIEDEKYYTELAKMRGEATVLLCDRGIMDGSAYMESKEVFLNKFGLDEEECLKRYHMVIHLDSLAMGNPRLYEKLKDTNPSRLEDAQKAIQINQNLIKAWKHHERFIKLNSRYSLEYNQEICLMEIGRVLREIEN